MATPGQDGRVNEQTRSASEVAGPASTLRIANSVRLVHAGSWRRRGFVYLKVGLCSVRIGHLKLRRREVMALVTGQDSSPVFLASLGTSRYWLYRDVFYTDQLPDGTHDHRLGSGVLNS